MTVVSPVSGVFTTAAKSSAESNFRELDDAFLQTQTRIWLGEVLQIRFDEDADISDILADGKLLSELSEVLSRMLPSLSIDATQPKTNELKSFVSSKSTQRYMPYYNVGSFLKMCKNLGMDGIDLFTPSDVVEKRNTRKVCMCMRSLSKRARSSDLNVPDFDSVTCTLTMPTNMVEGIRKSIEMSQSSSSLSVKLETDKRISNSASTVSNEYSSDTCDDAESSFVVGEFNGPSKYAYDSESPNMSCSQVTEIRDDSSALQLNTRDLKNEEDDQCEYLSPSNGESVGSPCSQYYSDPEISMPSYDYLGSHITGKINVNSETKPAYHNDNLSHIPINWEDNSPLDFENHSDDHANHDQPNRLEDSDISRHQPELIIGESFCDGKAKEGNHSRTTENMDLSSCVGENHISQFCTEVIDGGSLSCDSLNSIISDPVVLPSQKSFLVEQSSYTVDSTPHYCKSSDIIDVKPNDIEDPLIFPIITDHSEVPGQFIDDNRTFVYSETDSSMTIYDKETLDTNIMSSKSLTDVELAKENDTYTENNHENGELPENHRHLDVKTKGNNFDIPGGLALNSSSTACEDSQPGADASGSLVDTGHKHLQFVEDIEKGNTEHIKQESAAKDMPQHKPKRKLLKSVIKGTALLGVAVVLLHLRKGRQGSFPQVQKPPVGVVILSAPAPSLKKGQKTGKASSVYPAGKLNFGF